LDLFAIEEQAVPAAQIFNRVASFHPHNFGMSPGDSPRSTIFISQINIGREAQVRVETAQYQFAGGRQGDVTVAAANG
jgi:hypothetical protein